MAYYLLFSTLFLRTSAVCVREYVCTQPLWCTWTIYYLNHSIIFHVNVNVCYKIQYNAIQYNTQTRFTNFDSHWRKYPIRLAGVFDQLCTYNIYSGYKMIRWRSMPTISNVCRSLNLNPKFNLNDFLSLSGILKQSKHYILFVCYIWRAVILCATNTARMYDTNKK